MLVFSLIMTAFYSVIMIGFGLLFTKKPPKEINLFFGYRTPMSMKNEDTWKFAHQYAGTFWFRSGIMVAILSVMLTLILKDLKHYNQIVFGLFLIQLIVLISIIPVTEIALRKVFDKEGNRKQKS